MGRWAPLEEDVWSLGCVLYELAVLKSPFKAEGLDLYSLFQKISKGDYAPPPLNSSTSAGAVCQYVECGREGSTRRRPRDISRKQDAARDHVRGGRGAGGRQAAGGGGEVSRELPGGVQGGDAGRRLARASRAATVGRGGAAEHARRAVAAGPAGAPGDGRRRPAGHERRPKAGRGAAAVRRCATARGGRGWADERPGTSSGRRRTSPPDDRPPSSRAVAGRRAATESRRRPRRRTTLWRRSDRRRRRPAAFVAGRARASAIDDDDDVAKAASEGNRRRRRLQEDQPFHEVLGASESIVERLYVLGYAFKKERKPRASITKDALRVEWRGDQPSPGRAVGGLLLCMSYLISLVGGDAREMGEGRAVAASDGGTIGVTSSDSPARPARRTSPRVMAHPRRKCSTFCRGKRSNQSK